jgi:hypothetical protein
MHRPLMQTLLLNLLLLWTATDRKKNDCDIGPRPVRKALRLHADDGSEEANMHVFGPTLSVFVGSTPELHYVELQAQDT